MRLIGLVLLLICGTGFAQGLPNAPITNALSFAPPPTDVSLSFLGNIFGVVDGVLAGYGSQIFGRMMSVFNSAVLALGSIVSTYVLLLGTMHTAHEGEFLGKKWSSILIPLRTTIGLGLLIPKASGYCLIQIFFMWVVIQGIGAADKIWNAVLSYLNQGGQIIIGQPGGASPTSPVNSYSSRNTVYLTGIKILTGQVCMYGIEQILKRTQSQLQTQYQNADISSLSKNMQDFIKGTVPDFIGSVNAIDTQQASPDQISFSLNMPNFPATVQPSVIANLNGVCGTIKWQIFNPQNNNNPNALGFLSASELSTVTKTRSIAIQTMYNFLSNIAVGIINNNPMFGRASTDNATPTSTLQYGVPNENGVACKKLQSAGNSQNNICSGWGPAEGGESFSLLFSGNEFTNAVTAYMSVMAPALNLRNQVANDSNARQKRDFIAKTRQTGWMFAGAYFFNLIALSGSPVLPSGTFSDDPDSGLSDSIDMFSVTVNQITKDCEPNSPEGSLCWFLQSDPGKLISNLISMIRGGSNLQGGCAETLSISTRWEPSTSGEAYISPAQSFSTLACSSTVYGFVGNSFFFNVPAASVQFSAPPNLNFPPIAITPFRFPRMNMDMGCRGFACIASAITYIVLEILNWIMNFLQDLLRPLLQWVVNTLIVSPLRDKVWPMLTAGVNILKDVSNNPIVVIANMGAYFIQSTIDTYLSLLSVAAIAANPILPGLGMAINILLSMMLPFLTAWLSYFATIGMTTCYYVPLLPYLIFLFGALSWLFAVVEAIIAAPLVALIVTSPEGEGVIGKGEQGLMILLNIFLRPSLMVIGFVTAIAVTYVSVWMLSMSFGVAANYMIDTTGSDIIKGVSTTKVLGIEVSNITYEKSTGFSVARSAGIDWTNKSFVLLLGHVFYIAIYVSIYLVLVQKSFSLIFNIPDKVLRWIGGQPESYGQEIQQWMDMTQKRVEEMGSKTEGAIAAAPAGFQKATKDAFSGKKSDDKKPQPDEPGNLKTNENKKKNGGDSGDSGGGAAEAAAAAARNGT